LRKNELQDQIIDTVYFGGGTPSLLSTLELEALIDCVYNNFNLSPNPEITLEANPDDLSKERIQELANSRINRLSIGIQSFFEEDLKSMNRAHNAQEAIGCLKEAIRYFDNITIDLIYGIPEMSLDKWNDNLQLAFSFGINHISSYALTVEPKTALDMFIKKGDYPPIDEALSLVHFNHLVSETAKQGFVHYEISNFGKPNYFSKHNTSYWQGASYLGIGPSAHSFNGKTRSWNISNNTIYIKNIQEGILPSETEILSLKDQFNEYIMTGLRTVWGVSIEKINTEFGADYKKHVLGASDKFIRQKLLVLEDHTLKTTAKGKFLADGIASDLFMI